MFYRIGPRVLDRGPSFLTTGVERESALGREEVRVRCFW